MAWLKRRLKALFVRVEAPLAVAFGPSNQPFANLGTLGWYFFWIAAATGIYLYIFFDTGVSNAWESVEYITHTQWYAAGVMRSLHRYSSDALVVVVILHILREFAMDRLRGKRFFAWLTGIPLIWFIYICGISGYWLVWDELAQYIAITSAEWLDALPIFGEPIANNFLNSETLGDRFFTLMVFIHIFAPLFLLLLMWVHIQRHSHARVNPPRALAIGTGITLVVVSLVSPATSHDAANLDVVPATVNIDWFYLNVFPLLDFVPGGQLWLVVAGSSVLLALLPWLPPQADAPVAVVDLDNCNGCGRCVDDCPFSAIEMAPRSDGAAYDREAVVNADNCLSCGICTGACPTASPFRRAGPLVPGIELPDHGIADLRARVLEATSDLGDGEGVLVFACAHADAGSLQREEVRVLSMPCVGMLPPPFIDFVLSRRLAGGVMLAGCAENACHFRLGDEWVRQRVARERDPFLRERVDRSRLCMSWLPAERTDERARQLDTFARSLSGDERA